MKKVIVLIVALLVSQVTYGQNGWHDIGAAVILETSADKVGIGIEYPSKKLEVNGDIKIPLNNYIFFGNSAIQAYNGTYGGLKFYGDQGPCITMEGGGNVGIGTTSLAEKLNVNGSIRGNQSGALRISTGSGYVDIGPKNSEYSHFYTDRARYFFNKEIRVDNGLIGSYDENLSLRTSGTTRITILNSNGRVGIGTPTPQSELAVNGTITAKEVIVTADGWPDFVFADNYKLMPLNKLEKYIKINKSLPGIPKEKEVAKEGVAVGEMQSKLLAKVEELTLYVIELKKENEELKKTNKTLERRISVLEK